MMCYRDMTFCEYKECSKFDSCHRALTDKVQADAEKWWGSEKAPIATFASKPECFNNESR